MQLKVASDSSVAASTSVFRVAAIFIAIIPILLLVPLLVHNAINLPLMDQWDTPGSALVKAANGTLSFSDLIAQHNESRKLFPRLLFLGMAFMTGWDTRYEFLAIFLVACLISYQVYRLSRITIRNSEYKRLFLLFLANLLIFSPVQSENWLWGIQIITFIPIACITASLVVAYAKLEIKLKTLILMGLCTVSTYSYANGMLSWLLVFVSAIFISRLSQRRNQKEQQWLLFGGTAGFILNVTVYFYNYIKPPQTPSFSASLADPRAALKFFLIFLGYPLNNDLKPALIVGFVLLALFGCSLFYLFIHKSDQALLYRSIPWIAIGAYACVSGMVATAGRVGFGLQAALTSRYATFSLYLVVALLYLLTIVAEHIIQNYCLGKPKKVYFIQSILLLLITCFVILHTSTYSSHAKIMALNYRYRLHAKACLLFINVVDEKPTIEATIYPFEQLVKPRINQINQIHLLNPALVESPAISSLKGKGKGYPLEAYGYFDAMTRTSATDMLLSGWSVFPDRQQPADAVLLAYETSTGEPNVFAIAPVIDDSPDVAQVLHNQAYRQVRWHETIALHKLPSDAVKISAWAFDTTTRQAFQLAGSKRLP